MHSIYRYCQKWLLITVDERLANHYQKISKKSICINRILCKLLSKGFQEA